MASGEPDGKGDASLAPQSKLGSNATKKGSSKLMPKSKLSLAPQSKLSGGSSSSTTAANEEKASAEATNAGKKHPLQYTWTMWYDSPSPKSKNDAHNWQQNVKKIVSFSSVEDFWCLFNNLVKPSRLAVGGNYHLFKDGIMPAWEDPANEHGGKWVLELPRTDNSLNKVWMYTVLAMIGENFPDSNEICGAVVSLRPKKNRLALWTRTAKDAETQRRIGQKLKSVMELDPNAKLIYQDFQSLMKRTSGYGQPRNLYEV